MERWSIDKGSPATFFALGEMKKIMRRTDLQVIRLVVRESKSLLIKNSLWYTCSANRKWDIKRRVF